jgi:hypothetical protein
MSWGS